MKLRFTKMHGAGNDFVVLDGVNQRIELGQADYRFLADRNFGVGADQILLVEPACGMEGVDFRYRIFNADGGEVEQCGNGARCFARFVHDKGLSDKKRLRVVTLGGVIEPEIQPDGRVTVDMGEPRFDPVQVPFDPSGLTPTRIGDDLVWTLEFDGVQRDVSVLSMGNPHAVQFVDDIEAAPVAREGARIENSSRFPARVNAGFAQMLDAHRMRLRVWERGAGETLACGSGACAAAVAAMRRGIARTPVDVQARGGVLTIDWHGEHVWMTGPAQTVFEGEIEFDAASPGGCREGSEGMTEGATEAMTQA